jgi:hypothetical protein
MAFADRFHGNPAAQRQFADRQGEQVSFDLTSTGARVSSMFLLVRGLRWVVLGH